MTVNGPDWERPPEFTVLPAQDIALLKAEIESLGAQTILEFGPGESTEVFLSLGLKVTTCENLDKWLEVADKKFKDRARVLKFDDEAKVVVHGLDDKERFDIAFVDAPKGTTIGRKVHPEFADCSRFNTTLFALQRCKVVYLHDSMRPLEKGTLGRLNGMGYEYKQLASAWGLARITHGSDTNRPDLQGSEESRGASAGTDSLSRGVSVDVGSDRLDANRTGEKGYRVRRGRRRVGDSVPPAVGPYPGVASSPRVRGGKRPSSSGPISASGDDIKAAGVNEVHPLDC